MKTTIAIVPVLVSAALLLGCDKPGNYSTSSNESPNQPNQATVSQTNSWRQTSGSGTNRWRDAAGEPDNTGVNARDRGGETLTTSDQGQTKAEIALTQQIRKELMADSVLSTTAKNIKIITVDGKVTLRGPVNTEQEKTAIGEKARASAGVTDVDNQLEVKPQTNQ